MIQAYYIERKDYAMKRVLALQFCWDDPPAYLGDIMQERRKIELGAMRDLVDDLARERVILCEASRLDRD